jgi:two-component system OmpR family sensor kinase
MMEPRREFKLFLPWLAWASLCVLAMAMWPGEETVPYHLGYVGLAVAFGLDTWGNTKAYLALVGFTIVTGAILISRAVTGFIAWGETTEIPLMAMLVALMVWHVSNRHTALAVVIRLAEREREQASRRERLVRVTSHEMRTPLTIATGYVDLLRADSVDDHQRSDLDVVHDELDRLARVSDRMLRMFRYHEDLPIESADLDDLLARLGERWSVVAVRDWKVEGWAGRVVCSEERVRACLDTLVENALRYTGPGDTVRLFAHREAGQVVLGVADSGPGFDADQLRAINEPGELLSESTLPGDSRSLTGLGLSLVREVIESRGGTVQAGTAREGGAAVVLRMPLMPVNPLEQMVDRPAAPTVPREPGVVAAIRARRPVG